MIVIIEGPSKQAEANFYRLTATIIKRKMLEDKLKKETQDKT